MGRKNKNTVSVKVVKKHNSKTGEDARYIRVIANKKSTSFKVLKSIFEGDEKNFIVQHGSYKAFVHIDLLKDAVNYEYDLAGDDYSVNGIHKRYIDIYANDITSFLVPSLLNSILNHNGTQMNHLLYQHFESTDASRIIGGSKDDLVNTIFRLSFHRNLAPRELMYPDDITRFIFVFNFIHYTSEDRTSDFPHLVIELLTNKSNVIQAFKSFLVRKRDGQADYSRDYSSTALEYIEHSFYPSLTDELIDDIMETASIQLDQVINELRNLIWALLALK